MIESRVIAPLETVSERLQMHARLLDAVGQAVVATTADGTIIYLNRGAEDLYGYTAKEAIGRNVLPLGDFDQGTRHAGDSTTGRG